MDERGGPLDGRTNRLTAGIVGVVLGLAAGVAPPFGGPAAANEPDPVVPMIVGGGEATEPYPPIASVQVDRNGTFGHHCGAVLVHPRHLVTAAHCVTDWELAPADPATLRVRVGSAEHATGGQLVAVAEVVPHPEWDWNTGDGPGADIAVLRLATSVWLPRYPIAGPSPAVGTTLREVGWGSTTPEFAAPLAATLRQVDRRVLPDVECTGGGTAAGELCIGGAPGGACFGDSGGPGLIRIGGIWSVVGGVSRTGIDWQSGVYCGVPTIYTDLTFHRSWIRTVVRAGAQPPSAN